MTRLGIGAALRRGSIAIAIALLPLALPPGRSEAEDAPGAPPGGGRKPRTKAPGPVAALSQILGRPTDRSIALSIRAESAIEALVEYGTAPGKYTEKTPPGAIPPGTPIEIELAGLKPDTKYFYRLRSRRTGEPSFVGGAECSFRTQRGPGSTFTFALQGDSHPEREGKMYSPDLYAQTLKNVAKDEPDFYLTIGDDFSIDPLIERGALSKANVEEVYAHQRGFLGLVGCSTALFLVNGNHEEAAGYLLDGTADNPAVLAGAARVAQFPLPAPDAFYRGDAEKIEHVGLLRDYYAWTWGDALFVVLDPYWHCSVQVDADVGGKKGGGKGGKRGRDLWDVSIGDAQYRFLREALESSRARYVFVFAHHVLGTGRGGIEQAGLFEWGGRDPRGNDTFAAKRPGWEAPIHQLFVKHHVSVFFQGHDHLYAHQELDGVVYQETPNPADTTYTAFNREAYRSGDVFPDSGHLRVTVSPESARVDYVRGVLPGDETRAGAKNGDVTFSYTVKPRVVTTSGR